MTNHVVEIFLHFTGVICVSREKWSNQTRRFPLIWSLSVHKDFMHWSAPRLPPHSQFGCFTPLLASLVSSAFVGRKYKFKAGSGQKGRFLDPNPTEKRLSRPVPPCPKNTFPELPCPASKKVHKCVRADGGGKVTSDNLLILLLLRFILKLNVCISLWFAGGVPSLDILLSSKVIHGSSL